LVISLSNVKFVSVRKSNPKYGVLNSIISTKEDIFKRILKGLDDMLGEDGPNLHQVDSYGAHKPIGRK
jgi:hypothetical protein